MIGFCLVIVILNYQRIHRLNNSSDSFFSGNSTRGHSITLFAGIKHRKCMVLVIELHPWVVFFPKSDGSVVGILSVKTTCCPTTRLAFVCNKNRLMFFTEGSSARGFSPLQSVPVESKRLCGCMASAKVRENAKKNARNTVQVTDVNDVSDNETGSRFGKGIKEDDLGDRICL